MTKFGVYRGKDKAFAKRFASGGSINSAFISDNDALNQAAASGNAPSAENQATQDAMDQWGARQKYRNKKDNYQDAFDKAQGSRDATSDARYGSE